MEHSGYIDPLSWALVDICTVPKLVCVDPFRKVAAPITPLPLELPAEYAMLLVVTHLLPRACDVPFSAGSITTVDTTINNCVDAIPSTDVNENATVDNANELNELHVEGRPGNIGLVERQLLVEQESVTKNVCHSTPTGDAEGQPRSVDPAAVQTHQGVEAESPSVTHPVRLLMRGSQTLKLTMIR